MTTLTIMTCLKLVVVMLATGSISGYISTHTTLPVRQIYNSNAPNYSPGLDGVLRRRDGDDQIQNADHYLQQFRKVGDPLMDKIFSLARDEKIMSKVTVNYMQQAFDSRKDQRSPTQQAMSDYYAHYSQAPSWVDFAQLQRGMDVFFKYLPAIGTSLFFKALLTGFSFPGISEVLKETAYFNGNQSGTSTRRLIDTITYVTTNMMSAESLKPQGQCWKWGLEIRAIHGKVRHRLLNNKRNVWDTEKHGVPINPEDLAATLLGFSHAAVQGLDWILPVMTPTDKADYLSLWRYLGWLIGIDTIGDKLALDETTLDPLGGPTERVNRMNVDISLHLIQTTDYAKKLTKHLLMATRANINPDKDAAYKILSAMSHKWLGKDFASALGIPATKNLLLKAVVVGHINILRLYMIFVTKLPHLGRVAAATNRRLALVAINTVNQSRGFRRSFLDGTSAGTTGRSACPLAKFFSTMRT